MEPVLDPFNEIEATDTDQEPQTDTDRTDGEEEMNTTPSQSRSSSIRPQPHLPIIEYDANVFDGYSFKGRHSVLIDDDEDDDEEEEEEDSSLGEEESIAEEDNLSILERLEEEAAQIGETKSIVGDGDGDRDGRDDDVLVGESVLLDDYGVEPKTPEAKPAATLPPAEEVVVPPPPVVEDVVPSVDEEVVPPVDEVVVSPVEEVVVSPVEEVVVSPVAEEVVVLPVAEDVVPLLPEVDETITEATKVEESLAEPKVEEEVVPAPEVIPTSRRSVEELDDTEPAKEPNGEIVPSKELNGALVDTKESNGRPITPPPKSRQPPANRACRNRREKSGVFALDRYLSDAIDEATEAERDEDDDWDFVEAADGEDRNGTKGPSLFARGVVDRYRLAVFRKASIPTSRSGMRSVSGVSNASGTTAVSEATESPSPSQRRGRTPGLTFRKNPRQFLRPKSPPSSFSVTARSLSQSAASSNVLSAASTSSSGGGRLLSASHSVGSSFALSPSLKSKESAMSVGAQSQSSDQSVNGTTSVVFVEAADTLRGSPQLTTKGAEHKVKNKKLRRYKHNAEKVFSLFSSPRQAS
jgi:serum/glucocorticoid-regulated kinase 2